MVKLNKIYTKTGDMGHTGLVSGERIPKTDRRIDAIGTVDELNAAIGVALSHIQSPLSVKEALRRIQNDLFDLGADLATPPTIDGALRIAPTQVEWLETQIDAATESIPPLTSFILPAGENGAAHLHLARAIARRAERDVWQVIKFAKTPEDVSQTVPIYLNRLSDYLFVIARICARQTGEEVLWQPGEGQS